MAHVELPKEELQPLLESIQEAFEPLTKAMPLIMKIPEEIKRVADNISEDLGSGIPEKIDNAVEKITQDEAEDLLKKELSEAEQEAINKLTEQVELLRENGIPAEIKEGKVSKLTEDEIRLAQKQYIQSVEAEQVIQNQIDEVKKSNMNEQEMIEKIQSLKEQLEKQNQSRQKHEDKLAGRLPQMTGGVKPEGPRIFGEMKAAGGEVFGAPMMAITELKSAFTENFGRLFKMNRDHYSKMEGYGKTGERADKSAIAKFALLVGIAGLILNKLINFFGGGGGAEQSGPRRRDRREEMFGPTEERAGSVGLIEGGGTDNRTRGSVEGKKFEITDDKKKILAPESSGEYPFEINVGPDAPISKMSGGNANADLRNLGGGADVDKVGKGDTINIVKTGDNIDASDRRPEIAVVPGASANGVDAIV